MTMLKLVKIVVLSSALFIAQQIFAADMSDASITKDVKEKLAADPVTATLKINVTSMKGVVTLRGNVNTDEEASKAIELAESTPGVSNTKTSNLMVKKSNQPLTDTVITAKVKGSFIREKIFGDHDIDVTDIKVETTNGTVYLTGSVETQEQIDSAVRLAKSIEGVKGVDSKLTVKPAA